MGTPTPTPDVLAWAGCLGVAGVAYAAWGEPDWPGVAALGLSLWASAWLAARAHGASVAAATEARRLEHEHPVVHECVGGCGDPGEGFDFDDAAYDDDGEETGEYVPGG